MCNRCLESDGRYAISNFITNVAISKYLFERSLKGSLWSLLIFCSAYAFEAHILSVFSYTEEDAREKIRKKKKKLNSTNIILNVKLWSMIFYTRRYYNLKFIENFKLYLWHHIFVRGIEWRRLEHSLGNHISRNRVFIKISLCAPRRATCLGKELGVQLIWFPLHTPYATVDSLHYHSYKLQRSQRKSGGRRRGRGNGGYRDFDRIQFISDLRGSPYRRPSPGSYLRRIDPLSLSRFSLFAVHFYSNAKYTVRVSNLMQAIWFFTNFYNNF